MTHSGPDLDGKLSAYFTKLRNQENRRLRKLLIALETCAQAQIMRLFCVGFSWSDVMRNLFLVLLAMSPLAANADLIQNGSFETPTPLDPCSPATQCSGSFRNFNAPASFDGWSVVGAGQMSIGSTDFAQFGFNFPAQDGQQWADMSGFGGNDPVGIQQSVSTISGDFYDLSFWVGNVVDVQLGLFGTSSTMEVLLNGLSLGLFTNGDGGTTTNWRQFSISFQADSTSSMIAFFNADSSTDNMNGLDNIVLTGRLVTVPEPGTLALLGIGLFGMGLARRRKTV